MACIVENQNGSSDVAVAGIRVGGRMRATTQVVETVH
jgi:hypothetical protein